MMTRGQLGGGKTAPRLLQDLVTYDPRRQSPDGSDSLLEVPFFDAFKENEDPPLSSTGCQHRWAIKRNQSTIPPDQKYQPSLSSRWTLRCYCAKCRWHFEVVIHFDTGHESFSPCPTRDRPLHHFRVLEDWQRPDSEARAERGSVSPPKWFHCSAIQCGANVAITYTAPRLKNDWVSLLTDQFMIKSRADKTIAKDPERFQGHAPPTPGIVLETLSFLIKKALNESDLEPFPKTGKHFLLNFGEPCTELLEALGFTSKGELWQWPQLDPDPSSLPSDTQRLLLDDVLVEVYVLMLSRPDEERRLAKFSFHPLIAMKDMSLALGCDDYKRNSLDETVDLTAPEHPSYASLGAVADFHDDLIFFSYERQITTDNWNVSYYLECLQIIAKGRNSEELSTKAAIEESDGRISLRDIRSAYAHLGFNYDDRTLLDDNIIGSFQARLTDAPKQEANLRRDLKIIGIDRSSPNIQGIAAQSVNTYEQAMTFLDATEDVTDDFIISYFTVKVTTKPNEEATARQAVALIANHRKSNVLKHWLDTGEVGDVEMDLGQAYARFDISDRTISDETIIAIFDFHVQEAPSQVKELRHAFSTIARDRNSTTLLDHAGLAFDETSYSLSEWPVALNNIGNTCYLNSLLQFYFSIKPFRDLVLNIDDFTTPLDDESIKSKRIGGRSVSKKEVERAQRTVEELKGLFNDLITSPSRSVRPKTEVARLTLLTPKAEIARRQSIRQSLDGQKRPNLTGLIDGPSVEHDQQGTGPELSTSNATDTVMADGPECSTHTDVSKKHLSNSSSETLVDEPAGAEAWTSVHIQSEHHQPALSDQKHQLDVKDSNQNSLLTPEDPMSVRKDPNGGPFVNTQTSQAEAKTLPPNQPPPVPPRPKSHSTSDEAVKEAEFAAQQQDVNEIAYNILNQLQCAIRPEMVDSDGEQIDQIKQLFYGKQKSYITNQSGVVRNKEEFMSDIRINVQSEPLDIYSALDGAFDVEDVAVAGGIEPRYYTISHLPPILQIHIQRGQYDMQAKTQFKSDNHLDLKDIIYMDRYMDTTDPELIRQREESWDWKRHLARLLSRRKQLTVSEVGMEIPEVLHCATGYLNQLKSIAGDHQIDVPVALIDVLERVAGEAKEELKAIESSISELRSKISKQFEHLSEIPYKLAAVFIHRGSSNAGHYWVYIYDFSARIWRKYNDERVTRVTNVNEIFEEPTGPRPPTPYFLVYVRDQIKADLVDPVCRNVADVPSEEPRESEYEPIDLGKPMQVTDALNPSAPAYSGDSNAHMWDTSQIVDGGGW